MIMTSAKRNNYIDFLRGIAVIGVIAIHTAFWSGQIYTPEWFWNSTLFLDVPFFFYLSGWGSSYRKADVVRTSISLGRIWLKWVFFISLLSIFCAILNQMSVSARGVDGLKDFCDNIMFNVSFTTFPVVAGSIWFMPYYFIVLLMNTLVLSCIQTSSRAGELKRWYMRMLLFGLIWVSYGKYLFGVDSLYFIFYALFWMFGYNRVGNAKSKGMFLSHIIVCAIGFCLASHIQGLPLWNIQSAKFPPSLKYGFASMFVILLAKHMEQHISCFNSFIVHIGRNAIFYFFAQGIGSSICYYVVSIIAINNWFAKWCCIFGINVVITVVIAEVLERLYDMLEKIVSIMIRGNFSPRNHRF